VALFSDVDWAILLAVAGFLVLGKEGGAVLRQAGRLYGRFTRIKAELLTEFTQAAEIPAPVPGRPVSIRQSLLSWEPGGGTVSGIPAAVTSPPLAAAQSASLPPAQLDGLGPTTWSYALPGPGLETRSEP
jgi:hypothetical protein